MWAYPSVKSQKEYVLCLRNNKKTETIWKGNAVNSTKDSRTFSRNKYFLTIQIWHPMQMKNKSRLKFKKIVCFPNKASVWQIKIIPIHVYTDTLSYKAKKPQKMKDTERYAYNMSRYVLKQIQVHSAELGVDLGMKSSYRSYHIVI